MLPISVVICTRKPREDYFRRVLESLRTQTLPKDQWELLVISVAADGPLSDRFDISWHPAGRFLLEEKIGKTHAVLRAIGESNGELLVIVDDDNVLRADFLEASLKISRDFPHLGAWGGSCIAEFEAPPPPELKPWLAGLVIDKITTPLWARIPNGNLAVPAGAGMVVRRAQALHYRDLVLRDPARQALGPNGQPGNGGEDSDMALCAFDLGMGTGRFPDLELTHLIPARKLNLPYLETLYGAFAYSGVIIEDVHFKTAAHPGRIESGRLRFYLLMAYLWVSGKSRAERRIRLAMEKGRLRAFRELRQIRESARSAPQ